MTATTNTSVVEHRIGQRGRFTLRVPSGDVRVRAIDGDVARVRDLDGRNLYNDFQVETGDGFLSLRSTEGPFKANRDADGGLNFILDLAFLRKGHSSELEVELPRNTTVQLETASADVHVDGLAGDGRYRTASGELTLVAVGGAVDIEAVSGDVEVSSTAEMSIGCRTVSGEVTVRAAKLSRLQVTTTSGDVRAQGALAG